MGKSKAHFAGAYSTIRYIREEFKCEYPVEVWLYEEER
jgi:hypothetical protein